MGFYLDAKTAKNVRVVRLRSNSNYGAKGTYAVRGRDKYGAGQDGYSHRTKKEAVRELRSFKRLMSTGRY